jgi:O-antigen/teichoic acid export membrane protein
MAATSSPFRDALRLWMALGLAQLLSLVRGFWVPHFLSPADYGLLGTILLIQSYSAYLHLGVLYALSREVPLEIARGNYDLAEKISRTAMTLNLILLIPLVLGCIIVAIFIPDPQTSLIFIVLSLLIPLSRQEFFCDNQLKSHMRMGVISAASSLGAVLSFLLIIPAVWLWGLSGALGAMLVAGVYPVLHKGLGGGLVAPGWNGKVARRVLGIGFPLFLLNFSGFLFLVADRTTILGILGKEALGYYTIGVVVASFLTLIPVNLAFAFSPRILARYGATNDAKSLADYLGKPYQGSAIISGLLAGGAVIVLPAVLGNLLPAYLPGLGAAMVAAVAAVMIGAVSLPNEVLITLGRQKLMLPLKLATLVLAAAGDWFVLTSGWGLIAVACVNLIVYSAYTAWLTIWAERLTSTGRSGIWLRLLLTETRVLLPGGLAALLLWGTSTALGSGWGDWLTLAVALPLWLALTLPWSLWLLRDGLKLLKGTEV